MLTVHCSRAKIYYVSQLFVTDPSLSHMDRLSQLPVSLPIQLVGPYEYGTSFFGGVNQHYIRGHSLIGIDFYKVTNSQRLRASINNHALLHIDALVNS